MVRRKKLSPTGAKDTDGEYHNVHVNLNEADLCDEDGEHLLFDVVLAVILIAQSGQGRGCESRVPS